MFRPSHSLTVSNAKLALEAGLRAIAGGETEIDLGDVVAVDSAAVATLLAWQCAALNQGLSLHFSSLPSNLESLIDLYGVTDLLSSATESAPGGVGTDLHHH
jgi:phospholipid transport system transporter-binding protein